MKKLPQNKGIVLFDGYCNLCSWSVQFITKRDQNDYFRFASLQSEIGNQLIKQFNLPSDFDDSVVLIENGHIYFKSTAALRIAKKLKRFWPLSSIFMLVPQFIRDFIYTIIATKRFKWFGKKEVCYIPDKDEQKLFL